MLRANINCMLSMLLTCLLVLAKQTYDNHLQHEFQ